MTRPPLLGRLVARLILGPDADVLRGDLEESFRDRVLREGDSLSLRASYVIDACGSALHWYWALVTRRSPSNTAISEGGIVATYGPDLRQMWRGLFRRPGYAGMVALTLGLGIGATTTIYSIVDATLVRPLPYRDADRLVVIGSTTPGDEWIEGSEGLQRLRDIALPNFRALRARVRGIERAAAIERRQWMSPASDAPAELLDVANVESGFFDLVSVTPLLGRLPRGGDEARPGGHWGAAISYAAWQRRFGGDPNVIGKLYPPFVIIGVLPPDFVQPKALVGNDVQFWINLDPNNRRYTDPRLPAVVILARLERGISFASVRRDLAAAQARLAVEEPGANTFWDGKTLGVGINSLRDATIGTGDRPVLIFLGAALLLLALAGTNAANLLIVRGLEREGELSLRRALGAARFRLATSLVVESVALALAGGVVGLAIAVAGVAAFRRFGPPSLPRMTEVGVSWWIVIAGGLLSMLVGVVVGLVPAIRSSRADPLTNLRASLTAISPRGTQLRTSLAAAQLALAVVLGIGATLLFRSFVYLRTEPLGFEPQRLLTFTALFKNRRPWETWDEVINAVSTVPGVTAVAGASTLPFETSMFSFRAAPPEQRLDAPITGVAGYAVSPTYFATATIPLLRGRAFDSSDQPDSRHVGIINARFARATFGDRDPVGLTLRLRNDDGSTADLTVVGVVGDVVQARIEDGMLPAIYVPHTQVAGPMNVLVSTSRSTANIEPEIRRALYGAGLRSVPVLGMSSMESRIGESLATPRFQLLLIGTFAGTAMLLAAIGLYGTLAFTVRSRTRELGIRLAMGATRRQIFDLVLQQGLRVLGIGLGIGFTAALGLTRLLQGFLYRVSPIDPLAFAAAALLVILAVVLATLRPANRAANVDPLRSIRAN